jgi:hypothetical protein
MRLPFILMSFLFFPKAKSQTPSNGDAKECERIYRNLSQEWKADSTGNGGFRLQHSTQLLSCKGFRVTKSFLLETLGKPNHIREVYKGIQYLYYNYDCRTLPKDRSGPRACWYVFYQFADGADSAILVDDGDTDL